MRNIEIEKQKLRLIQQKQLQLNNIIQQEVKQINVGTTAKVAPAVLYNVDAKKTKKNIANIVVDVVIPKKEKETEKENEKDAVPVVELKEKSEKNESKEKTERKEKPEKTAKKKAESNEPYKYYSKKEKPDHQFPSKTELYNSETFETSLPVALGIQPIYHSRIAKDKKSIEDKKTILKEAYGIMNLDKFKDIHLDIVYKILNYDKIIML